MLTDDELMEIEGDVGAALRFAGLEDDTVTDLFRACVKITGGEPQIGPMRRREGKWDGRRVSLRMDLYGTARGRQVLGHELGHAFGERFLKREVTEEWCDAFGAMLAAPRRHVRACISVAGHRVHRLAELLDVEQEASLLRLAEVTGRPCALERKPGIVVARGEPFPWPPTFRDVAAAKALGLHPIKVGTRLGMMAERAA